MQVFVEGSLKVSKYENKDKEERLQVSVIAHKVDFFGGKDENSDTETEEPDL